jgi:predicted nuclease of restriction endonuclease-like (RecB) superfamily
LKPIIGSTSSNQLEPGNLAASSPIGSTLSNLIDFNVFYGAFVSISFSHHFAIITNIKARDAQLFYTESAAAIFLSLTVLEHQIENDLFAKKGKLSNNFTRTLPANLKPTALNAFKDESLLDFIAGDELDDERKIEQQVVLNIRNFILQMGKGFCFIGNTNTAGSERRQVFY